MSIVNLTELIAKRAKMEPGEWERIGYTLVSPQYDIGRCDAPTDADGIVAIVNAADVLIEIAKASIEHDAAVEELNNYLLSDRIDELTMVRVGRRADQAKDAYRNALAKVTL